MKRRLGPWMLTGFVVMVITGALLFYAIPVRSYQSIFFRAKVIALILAGLNAFVFHSTIDRRVAEWDLAPVPPRAARRAGATSLVLWAVIVVAGRMIAYNWFDCDKQPQPKIVNVFAGCVVPGEGAR
jgi:ABC-type transport system involved in cytochrome c biogenesis permease subunit